MGNQEGSINAFLVPWRIWWNHHVLKMGKAICLNVWISIYYKYHCFHESSYMIKSYRWHSCICVHLISVVGAGCCIYICAFCLCWALHQHKLRALFKIIFTGILSIDDSCNFVEKILPILLIYSSNCHRDGSLPVSFIKKYLAQKLHLASEAEVTLSLPSFFSPWVIYMI